MDAKEVAKHNSRESCWVIINNVVYDVTYFLDSHPGGSKIILKLAGQDATSEYDPIHPPGTLEENLTPSQILGPIDPSTLSSPSSSTTPKSTIPTPPIPPLEEQLNIDDFAHTAERILPPKSWAYYSSASDDLITKHHNNTAYKQILLRPRIFRDVKDVDTTTTICGSPSSLPIFVAPAAMARLAHPTGEAGIAEACGAQGVIQCVSNNASLRPEQIVAARKSTGQPLWFQLYVQIERSKSEALLQRINTLGFTAIVLTLDAPTPGKREADERVKFGGESAVSGTSGEGGGVKSATAVKSEGLGRALFAGTSPSLTWEDLKWLRSQTHLPIILKGLQTHEDAAIAASRECRELGVTGIILSNHGGRGADTAPPPVYTLLEIRRHVPEVLRRLEVYVDGGIRRGTDVVKALCLGATAVGIGRPALFGLSGYGPEGVERVLTILREEVETAMRLLGVNRIDELGMQHINARALEGLIYMPEPDNGFVRAKL
ncbi:uncharacterized protein LAJ45_00508 [Morchella importuna]|uniref:uncharacterized protein n=1 Tax=Morchella importuna TaxID=1174673 RepID=UPI001E8D5037|nr:uncharacterized protein LAJ45_00508 [Morchella importuna]KAH8155498.1 hypothetical protein LAJ45_00508 [Morchella importuna]